VEKRKKRIKAGFSIDMILSDLLHLKKEQRKVRQFVNVAFKVKVNEFHDEYGNNGIGENTNNNS
jgi:hypothetical protein